MRSMKTLPAIQILLEAMESASVTPEMLAQRLGRSLPIVSAWLTGNSEIDLLDLAAALDACERPSREVGQALCALLDVAPQAA